MIPVVNTPYAQHRTPFAPSQSEEFLPTFERSRASKRFTVLSPKVIALTGRIEQSITFTHTRKIFGSKVIDDLLDELSRKVGQHGSGLMMMMTFTANDFSAHLSAESGAASAACLNHTNLAAT